MEFLDAFGVRACNLRIDWVVSDVMHHGTVRTVLNFGVYGACSRPSFDFELNLQKSVLSTQPVNFSQKAKLMNRFLCSANQRWARSEETSRKFRLLSCDRTAEALVAVCTCENTSGGDTQI